ncbi:MAG TPA: hypothetical protein DIC18_01790 [Clostridiales bacterium]|nr:hypothetical protein [Clostridiales bacterium]HCU56049.1 hypothetical protein [Clostridiales bacterium]
MKYKLITSDFDNTVYDGERVHPEVKKAIAAYRRAGGKFVIATGRVFASILHKLPCIGEVDDEVIACQGSAIYRASTGEVLERFPLSPELASKAVQYFESRGIVCHAYADMAFYTAEKNPLSEAYADYCEARPTYLGRPLSEFLPEMAFTNKIIGILGISEIDGHIQALAEYLGKEAEVTKSSPIFLEVTSANAGKGNSLRALAKRLGIPMEQTVAVGDNLNDLSMVEAAGLGVSVENGVDKLKQKADLIVPSVTDGGVARLIERILDNDL